MFTGLKSSVENAKLMLEYHMEHLKVQIYVIHNPLSVILH